MSIFLTQRNYLWFLLLLQFLLVAHVPLVGDLLAHCDFVLAPVPRASPPLVPHLLLLKNILQVATLDLRENCVWIDPVGSVAKLILQSWNQICGPRPVGNFLLGGLFLRRAKKVPNEYELSGIMLV